MTISAVVITKDEEKNIEECIKTLKFCDEVIVIDDYSEDKTVEKCQMSNLPAGKASVKIYRRKLNRDFASQRNYGLKKAKGKWVLFVDADERVSLSLRSEIIQIVNNPMVQYSGCYVRRRDYMWGRELKFGETGSLKLLRLAKRNSGKWKRRVHEVWNVTGETFMLKNPLLHYPHPTLRKFISNVNKMSSLHAGANYEEGKRASILHILIWPKGKFVQNYFLKLGVLDGIQGFLVAAMMSFHSYLAWGKQWFLQKEV